MRVKYCYVFVINKTTTICGIVMLGVPEKVNWKSFFLESLHMSYFLCFPQELLKHPRQPVLSVYIKLTWYLLVINHIVQRAGLNNSTKHMRLGLVYVILDNTGLPRFCVVINADLVILVIKISKYFYCTQPLPGVPRNAPRPIVLAVLHPPLYFPAIQQSQNSPPALQRSCKTPFPQHFKLLEALRFNRCDI